MNTTLHIIHLVHRTDRKNFLMKQLDKYGIEHRIWYGIENKELPHTGISRSHKRIIQFAKDSGLDSITVAEDDIRFTCAKSWKHYLENMPKGYDLYLGTISGGEVNETTKEPIGWSGLILYTIHRNFYDCFLEANENTNIDRWLSGAGLDKIAAKLGRPPIYKVCYPIVATCVDGLSDNSKKMVEHADNFAAYQKFK